MNEAKRERITEVMGLIREDAKNDAYSTEGMELTGKNLGMLFGNIFAAIDGLARAIEELVAEDVA